MTCLLFVTFIWAATDCTFCGIFTQTYGDY